MKKRFLSVIVVISIIFMLIPSVTAYEYDSQSVTVYVTVNDITDVDEPLNTLVERIPLTVTNFDLSQYGEGLTGIPIIDSGVTYLHVLAKLHEYLYGRDGVCDNFKLDSDGVTRIFMGRSVGSIMYKNGNYIFGLPQYIQVYNGDEVNICLYDEGYNQAIASFSEAYVNAKSGETLDLSLYKHHWYPEIYETISGAYIVNENGELMADENGSMIITDEDGEFSVTFPDEGTYKITIMPTLGYYMSQSGGTTVTWWTEEEIIKEVERMKLICYRNYLKYSELTDGSTEKNAVGTLREWGADSVLLTTIDDWTDKTSENEFDSIEIVEGTPTDEDMQILRITTDTEKYTEEITVTELVKHEEYISGTASQKVDYTTPWVIVNVTDNIAVKYAYTDDTDNSVNVSLFNAGGKDGKAIMAAYDEAESNGDVPVEIKSCKYGNDMKFEFTEKHDKYRLYFWDGKMRAYCSVYEYTYQPKKVAAWNYTRPKPTNVIITGGGDGE